LRTIVEQSDAHSVSVWDRTTPAAGSISSPLSRTAGSKPGTTRSIPRRDSDPGARSSGVARGHSHGKHAVLEDIDQDRPGCVLVQNRMQSGIGYRRHDPDAAMALLKSICGLGVRAILFVPMLVAGTVAGIIGIRFKQTRTFRRKKSS